MDQRSRSGAAALWRLAVQSRQVWDGRRGSPAADEGPGLLKTIAVIEGDDAAPEAMRPTVELLQALNLGLDFVYPQVGEEALAAGGSAFPDAAKAIIDGADATFFGAASGSAGTALMYLRWGKQTYANVRPCQYLPGCASPLRAPEGIDFAIVRENLEDLYVGCEGPLEDLAPLGLAGRTIRRPVHHLGAGRYAIKAITRAGTERVVRFACELAAKRRGKLTCAAKYNMLRGSDGFFVEVAEEVAGAFPNVEFERFIVDDFACRMIREPQRFDVVVMPNLYGDILSDAAGGLLGSLGLAPSACYGDDYAYFEPAHGTAPDIAGRNVINPTATLLSAAMMLEYLDYPHEGARLREAVRRAYADGRALTPDQGGKAGTAEFCRAVAAAL